MLISQKTSKVILGQCCFTILILFVAMMKILNLISIEDINYILVISFSIYAIWCLLSWRYLTCSMFDPYIMFICSAILFNGGQIILEFFGLNGDGILAGSFNDQILADTILFVFICLISFHFGALVSFITSNRQKLIPETELKVNLKVMRCIGYLLLALSIIPWVLTIKQSLGLVISAGYLAIYQQEQATGLNNIPEIIGTFLVPSALIILGSSNRNKGHILVSAVVIILYAITWLFIGRRNQAIMPLLSFMWLWHKSVCAIPKWVIFSMFTVMFFVVFPVVYYIRDESRSYIDFFGTFLSIENPALFTFKELGRSMSTVAYTLQLVPSERDYDFGLSYLYGFSTLIPNFFWEIHPAVERGTATYWIVWAAEPLTASLGGGIGYSFIAEAYLNFGWFGILPLFFIGYFYSRFVLWGSMSYDVLKLTTVACLLSFFLFFARSETIAIIRPIVWYSLIPYFLIRYSSVFITHQKSYKQAKGSLVTVTIRK